MNRYTMCLYAGSDRLEAGQVKEAISRILLSRPTTLRFGAAKVGSEKDLLIEVASDADRGRMDEAARALQARLGLQQVSVAWGWPLTQADQRATGTDNSPYAKQEPQRGELRRYEVKRRQLLLAFGAPPILAVLIAAYFELSRLGVLSNDWIRTALSLLIILVWFAILPNFRVSFATTITCDGDGLEVRGLLRPARRLAWEATVELHADYSMCTVYGRRGRVRLQLQPPLMIPEVNTAVRTIIERANLVYVGNQARAGIVFKRADAP